MRYPIPRQTAFLALLLLTVGTPSMRADEAKPSTGARAGINGRVTTRDENTKDLRAVPGAHIEIISESGKTMEATSDHWGFYSVAPLSAGTYFFRVTAAGFRDENSGRGFQLKRTEGNAIYDFTLQKGTTDPNAKPPELPKVTVGKLRGQIYGKTPTGVEGVNGARVNLRKVGTTELLTLFASAPTEGQNSSGYFRDEIEAGQWQINVEASGFDPAPPVIVEVLADQMRIEDLTLTRPTPPSPKYQGLRGTVTLADASPGNTSPVRMSIHHLADRAEGSPEKESVQLGAGGKYQVDRQPGRYFVVAEADGYLTKRSEIGDVLAGSYTEINLKLERRPAELVVKVFSAESKQPLGEATLRLRRPNEPLSKAVAQKTDAAGLSTFKSTPAGDFQVLAQMTGYKAAGKPVQIRAGEVNNLELFLTPDDKPATLTVYVYDGDQTLSEATVVLTPAGEAASESVTDSKGVRKVTAGKPGRYQLAVSKSGFIGQNRQVALEAGENTQLFYLLHVKSLDPTLTLLVTDAKKGTPLAGVNLRITPALPDGDGLKTDVRGAFDHKLPAPGRYTIEMTMAGYHARTEALVATAGNNSRRIQLDPLGPKPTVLVVQVVQASGERSAIAGARVHLQPAVRTESSTPFDGVTDARGNLTSSALFPQTYTLSIDKEGYEPSKTTVTLSPGDNPQTIALIQKSTVPTLQVASLTLTILGGETPIAGAEIKIQRAGRVIDSGSSTEKGGYHCQLPGTGLYVVTVSRSGYEPSQTSVDVTFREVSRKISLKPVALAKRTMNVLVREGGTRSTVPIEGADVKIHNNKDEVVRTGRTNALGRFRADNLEVGVYTIEVSKAGYTQRERPRSDITRGDDQPEVPLFRAGTAPPPKAPGRTKADDLQKLLAEAQAQVDGRKYDDAIQTLYKAEDLFPKDPATAALLQRAEQGKKDQAAQAARQKEELARQQEVQKLVQQGRTAVAAKNWEAAYSALSNAAKLAPKDADVLRAEDEYNKAFAKQTEELAQQQQVQKLVQQGRTAITAKDWTAAATAINAAAKLAPKDADVVRVEQEYQKAADAFRAARAEEKARQQEVQKLVQQGRTATAAKNWEAAYKALSNAAKLAPKDADVLAAEEEYNKAYTKQKADDEQAAQAAREEQARRQEVQKLVQQGRTAIAAKDWTAAATAINAAARLAPKDPDVGRVAQEYQKATDAFRAARAEEQRRQQEVQRLVEQGRTAIAAKNWEAAFNAIASAAKLAPRDADVLRVEEEYTQARARQKAADDQAAQTAREEQARQQEVRNLVQQGRTAIAAKSWKAAFNALSNAAKLAPRDADVLRAEEEYNQALRAAKSDTDALKRKQAEFQAHLVRARQLLAAKRYEEALSELNDANRLIPGDQDTAALRREVETAITNPQANARPKPAVKYVALAISKSTGRYGYSAACLTLNEAKEQAVKNCKAADAAYVVSADDGWWLAVAEGNGGSGYGVGATAAEAQEKALRECAKGATNGVIKVLVEAK